MIRKLSESWKQQKLENTPNSKSARYKANHVPANGIENLSMVNKDTDEIFGMSAIDWDASILASNREKNSAVNNAANLASTPLETKITDRRSQDTTINSSMQRKVNLANWGLPMSVIETYQKIGVEQLFPWQQECLMTGNVLEGGNLVYSAPTSAGKTLVAEILMLKRVLETKKKVIYILPFVSVAREKVYSLRNQFEEAGVKVAGFMGSEFPPGGFKMVDIAVCTIEKANSLVNKLMESKKICELCCVIVDEMHMIGDPGRGYLLELLLTKLRFLSSTETSIQIIGMSATLPNLDMLASWLKGHLYHTNFRPVPLSEHIKVGASILDGSGKKISEVKRASVKGDEEGIIPLCLETMTDGNSVVIFCPTKNWCEKLSETIAAFFEANPLAKTDFGFRKASEVALVNKDLVKDVIDQLKRTSVGLDKTLEKIVREGVAYHHAGLTFDERDILEGAFRRGALKVLVATSTLSSGVNLPARRVIIRSPMFHGRLLDALVYKQMAGRAGRKNVDTKGESILVCKPAEKQKALSLLSSRLNPVYSCLLGVTEGGDTKSFKRALLEVIAAGVATTPQHVQLYGQSTYLHTCLEYLPDRDANASIMATMKYLLNNEFISIQTAKTECGDTVESYSPTQLGSATLSSALSPNEALLVFHELSRARKRFVLEGDLHVIYQVTPIYLQDHWPDLDWLNYYELWERLSPSQKAVGELVGVQERFLARAIRNSILQKTEQQIQTLRIHRRFYGALVLQDLVNEMSLSHVSSRYKINRGLLQSLQNSAATFAGMVTVFCEKLGWSSLELLLDQFQKRLSFGISSELCNLVRIPLLNGFKARVFYEHGYQTVSSLVNASVGDVARIFRDMLPFESRQSSRANARNIWLVGQEGLTQHQAARMVIKEAKRILIADAAVLGIAVEQMLPGASPENVKGSPGSLCTNKPAQKRGEKSTVKRRSSLNSSFENASKRISPEVKKYDKSKLSSSFSPVLCENTFDDSNSKTPLHDGASLKVSYERDSSAVHSATDTVGEKKSSCDSMCDVPLCLLKPEKQDPFTPLDFSLQLSGSQDSEIHIVPPMKLGNVFDAAETDETFVEDVHANDTSQSLTYDESEFLIIDVAADKNLLLTFLQEWKIQKTFSFSVAFEKLTRSSSGIGANVKTKSRRSTANNADGDVRAIGLAVCWGGKDAYYLSLESNEKVGELDGTFVTPVVASNLSRSFREKVLKRSFSDLNCTVVAVDIKEKLKLLHGITDCLLLASTIQDPKVAHWMLHPSEQGTSINALSKQFLDIEISGLLKASAYDARDQDVASSRVRSCVESVVVYHLMEKMGKRLREEDLWKPFIEIEMPTIRTLLVMELNGIGFSDSSCESLKGIMKKRLRVIEKECYKLAGRPFSLTSHDDVSKVLFVELSLPNHAGNRITRKSSMSTCKGVLEKLVQYHGLPRLILEWRRINNALTKVIYPVQRRKALSGKLNMHRVYSEAQYRTCTGRVTFSEPNLQNVPKEFDIKRWKKKSSPATDSFSSPGEMFSVSMRSTFIPFRGGVIVTADYCQLELRLIAHLSADRNLLTLLNTPREDVFKNIAAEVDGVAVDRVTPVQRQRAKEICYGMIYGIGAKALSEQLRVVEEDAAMYMEGFKERYQGVKHYIEKTIADGRKKGYVESITGRKRFLPALNSKLGHVRSHGERQAVNTTIQGSAADLVKLAMNNINNELHKTYGRLCLSRDERNPAGAYLVLQIHDELMYEVHERNVAVFTELIRKEMEGAMTLNVRMPVKIKIGPTWGELDEYNE